MKIPKYSNKAVATMLREVEAAYEVKGGDLFRIRAYGNAATSIEHTSNDIKELWEEHSLDDVPGIGKGIATYLDEYFKTGKVKHFEEVKKGLPAGMFKLLDVPSIGAKRAFRLAKELKIENIDDLKHASSLHKVSALSGFGDESERDILKGIKELESADDRLLFPDALFIAETVISYLKKNPNVKRADPLGSLRRGVATIGDIDIGVACENGRQVIDYFIHWNMVREVVSAGDVKATVLLKTGRQVDIVTENPASYGSLLQYFTGSKAHNIHLRGLSKQKGLTVSEHGIKNSDGKKSVFADETGFYNFLGFDYIPPEIREDTGEIDAAQKGELPELIEFSDIKGDLHMHSDFLEGENSIEEMIRAGEKMGYQYIGISDHNPSVKARGEAQAGKDLAERAQKIKDSAKKHEIKVFTGLEVSITTEGKMSLPDNILQKLDYVIASVHTSLGSVKEKQTERILAAIKNSFVDIIGHPTGRLLQEREGYELDFDAVFAACVKYDKALEINAYPSRLDLSEGLIREAIRRGVKLVIGSDSHDVESLPGIRCGVTMARRGWAEKSDILNNWDFERIERWLVGRRQ